MSHLKVDNGPDAGRTYVLANPKHVIGRHPDCDIFVNVGAVSRQHAQVIKEGKDFFVEDLNSRNKTFLNETEITTRQPLKPGDKIKICDIVMTFHDDVQVKSVRDTLPASHSGQQSGLGTVVMEDGEGGQSSVIMTKLDVSSSRSGSQLISSPQARLAAMLEITQALGKTLKLDEVLPRVIDSLFKIFMQADRGFIGLLDEQGKLIPRWSKLRRDGDESIRVSRTIVRQVMDTKEAILSADAASDSRFEMSQSIADFRIRSMMCAPLVDSLGKAIGVLQIDTMDQRKRFQPDDLELLVSIASQAAIAIDNAQLHDTALRQQSVEQDLRLAQEVQQAFLPDSTPAVPGYEFWSFYQPMDQIGGDYYDYVSLPDGRTAVIVADVVGHGVAAAMLMAKLSAEARFSLASETQVSAALKRLNDRMSRLQIDRFATLVMVVLNPQTHEVVIVNAGHMAPVYRHADRSISEPGDEIGGLPLGIMEGSDYQQMSIHLKPGESLTMYTDGVNEAANRNGDQFSIERLRKHVRESDGSPTKIGETIKTDVFKFLDGKPQDDDMCLVCVRRSPS